MEGNESKEMAVPKRECPDFLAQAKRVNASTVWGLEVFNGLPLKAGVPVYRRPFHLAQPAQRRDHLPQLRGLQAKKNVLERRAVEVEPDPVSAGGHARGSRPWSPVRQGRRHRTRQASWPRPRRGRA